MGTSLRQDVPKKWNLYCDNETDKFGIIKPEDVRIMVKKRILQEAGLLN